jgi:hypothetical protein
MARHSGQGALSMFAHIAANITPKSIERGQR